MMARWQPLRHDGAMDTPTSPLAARLIRNFNDVELKHWARAPLYEGLGAALAGGTAAQKLGLSIDIVPPGKQSCPYHLHHAQEEMFIVLEGSGTLRVAGERLPVRAGDVIFIPAGPQYPHQLINSSDAPLKYLSISTQETPEICEYPDSGNYLAVASNQGARSFRAIQKKDASLDYWDGEA